MHNICAQTLDNMCVQRGIMCEMIYTGATPNSPLLEQVWGQVTGFIQFVRQLYLQLSTPTSSKSTSVIAQVLPTIHSAYYYFNQGTKKENDT